MWRILLKKQTFEEINQGESWKINNTSMRAGTDRAGWGSGSSMKGRWGGKGQGIFKECHCVGQWARSGEC